MRIAHLADLHLGFRMYERTNPRGANQREADVAAAVRWAVDDILEQRPDAVIIAGDLFHAVRPTNSAIMFLFGQLQRIRENLPRTEVLAVAGNHDTPRTAEVASILPLYRALGVHVHLGPTVQELELAGVRFVLAPSGAAVELGKVKADDAVLLCHGEAPGEDGARSYSSLVPTRDLIPSGVLDAPWAYCALGHEHVFKPAGRGGYSGATEYTSTDPWGEMREQAKRGAAGKGYALVELGRPAELRVNPGVRRHVDLPAIKAEGMGAATLTAAIEAALYRPIIEGAIARLVVLDVTPEVRRAVDQRPIREAKALALNLNVKYVRPERTGDAVEDWRRDSAAADRKRRSLVEQVDDFLGERKLPDDVDRGEIRKLAREYVEKAGAGLREGPDTGAVPAGAGESQGQRGEESGGAAPAATSPALPTTTNAES